MTENLAGRGEGLAGLVARIPHEVFDEDCPKHYPMPMPHMKGKCLRCAFVAALEAAGPAGTAPASLIEASKNLLEACYQADALEELPQEIDGSLLDAVRDGLLAAAALATPSPQAPATTEISSNIVVPNPDCPLCFGTGSWVEGQRCACTERPLR